VSIYSALNSPANWTNGSHGPGELQRLISADGICVYLLAEDGRYQLRFSCGIPRRPAAFFPLPAGQRVYTRQATAVYHFRELPPNCSMKSG